MHSHMQIQVFKRLKSFPAVL